MRRLLFALCFSLVGSLSIAAAEPVSRVSNLTVTGKIEIGISGQVQAHTLDTQLSPAIRDVIARSLAQWQFEPILVDGHAVVARTKLTLVLEAKRIDADNFQLIVRDVWFGQPTRKSTTRPPSYPRDAATIGLGAQVTLVLRLDENGKVSEAMVSQVNLSLPGGEALVEKWRHVFEKASLTAARRWQFDLADTVNGDPIGTTVSVTINYHPTRSRADSWHGYVPGPIKPVPWLENVANAEAASEGPLEDGEMRTLNSRFRLRNEVIGQIL